MTILDHYIARHPRSQALYEQARTHFPNGVTHDARFMEPFPLAIERATGAYTWDVDGNRLIDYWQGHGSLLLGHAYGPVVEAIQRQAARGTHYGANHELEIAWATQVKRCFPQIELLRFTASGTEATMLALRLARAYTRKPTIVRLAGHFHGWHDQLAGGAEGETDLPVGTSPGIASGIQMAPADLQALNDLLDQRDDLAAIILEPSGGSYGRVPLPAGFLRGLRACCTAHGVLLICDEVVTGFRITPGGAQAREGVQADLTCLAKILAGGLPGGAVGGRAEILKHLAFGDAAFNQHGKIKHQGTYNANPLSAAAGVAVLEHAATGAPQTRASRLGDQLRFGLNAELRQRNLRGCAAYGEASIVHFLLGARTSFPPGEPPIDLPLTEWKAAMPTHIRQLFRLVMLNYGVDLMRGTSAFVSAAHTEADIAATITAFGAALDMMKNERDW